jgi:hypothetical protein
MAHSTRILVKEESMAKTTLVTHVCPDLDGLLGLWILIRFGGVSPYELAFVPVGTRLPGNDDAIHVDTGLGEFDHHQTSDDTCSAKLVYEHVFRGRSDVAVAELVNFALLTDWYRDLDKTNAPFNLNSVIEGLNELEPRRPERVAETTFQILDALHRSLTVRFEAEQEYAKGHAFASRYGRAFAIETANLHVRELAYRAGARVYVFVDPVTGYRGYKARSQDGVDFTKLFHEVTAHEPDADWFLHSSRELLLCGSAKAPDRRLSKLSLNELASLLVSKAGFAVEEPYG